MILKNNTPRYLLVEFNIAEEEESTSTENLLAISKRLIEKNMQAYEILAKQETVSSPKSFNS